MKAIGVRVGRLCKNEFYMIIYTSMSDEHPSKCSRIQSKGIDRDPGSCKQIYEFLVNEQEEIFDVLISKLVHINLEA